MNPIVEMSPSQIIPSLIPCHVVTVSTESIARRQSVVLPPHVTSCLTGNKSRLIPLTNGHDRCIAYKNGVGYICPASPEGLHFVTDQLEADLLRFGLACLFIPTLLQP